VVTPDVTETPVVTPDVTETPVVTPDVTSCDINNIDNNTVMENKEFHCFPEFTLTQTNMSSRIINQKNSSLNITCFSFKQSGVTLKSSV
jgi:hypothetical protein